MLQNFRPGFIATIGMAAMIISCSVVLWSAFWATPFAEAPKDYVLVTKVIGHAGLCLLVIATWMTIGILGRMIIRQEQRLVGSRH